MGNPLKARSHQRPKPPKARSHQKPQKKKYIFWDFGICPLWKTSRCRYVSDLYVSKSRPASYTTICWHWHQSILWADHPSFNKQKATEQKDHASEVFWELSTLYLLKSRSPPKQLVSYHRTATPEKGLQVSTLRKWYMIQQNLQKIKEKSTAVIVDSCLCG